MAGPFYLRSSDGNDGDDGLSWANAFATMNFAATQVGAGEILYVDDDHQETLTGDETWAFGGTEGNPVIVIVVTTDTTTAVAGYNCTNQNISGNQLYHTAITGSVYFWGICITPGDSVTLISGANTLTLENSKIKLDAPFGGDIIAVADEGTRLILINTDIEFADADDCFYVTNSAYLLWYGGTLTFDVDILLELGNSEAGYTDIVGVDLSAISGGSLVKTTGGVNAGTAHFKGCKMNATTPALVDGGPPPGHGVVQVDISDSGNTIYKFQHEYQYGTASEETTLIVTGKGLYDGTNEYSVKMVSRAAPTPTFYDPWRYHLCTKRVSTLGSGNTFTVYTLVNGNGGQPAALNNDEIWLEVVYPDDSTVQYNIQTDKKATPTTAAAAQADDTGRWTGETNGREQKLEVTVANGEGKAGPVEIWVCLAKSNTTVYVCPEVIVS